MNLDYPIVNVTCRCGSVLFSWLDVQAHYNRHRHERDSARDCQRLMAEMVNAKRL